MTNDWWSLGVVLYEMKRGITPFYSMSENMTKDKVMNTNPVLPEDWDRDTCSLLKGLLTKDPSKRLVKPFEIKRHPYFWNIDWDALAAKKYPAP